MDKNFDVVIIGLGPVGSLLAALLNEEGLKVLGIEKDKEIFQLPRAITINDESLRIMQSAGLEHVYSENSTPVEGAEFINSEHQRIGEALKIKGLITQNAWNPISFFHQPTTDQNIRNILEDSEIEILLEENLIDIQQKESVVEIETENLITNKKSLFTSNFLVGADGSSSTVRNLLAIEQEDLDYNREWVVVDVKLKEEIAMSQMAAQICDPKRLATYIPAHLPYKRWEFLILDDEDKKEIEKEETIQRLIEPWLKPDQYSILRSAIYKFHAVLAKDFKVQNCFLIGDAAHQTPPFMGEGMNTGFRDASNLAWKLVLALKEKDFVTAVLNSYQTERRPHAQFIVENSVSIGKLMAAYAAAENPDDVPEELVNKGYASYIIPNLHEGLFYGGIADPSMGSGSLFPQFIEIKKNKIIKRKDNLLGSGFAIISKKEIELSREEEDFYNKLNTKIITIEEDQILQNHWLSSYMQMGETFIVRPDKYIFGCSSDRVSFQELTIDLKNRLRAR